MNPLIPCAVALFLLSAPAFAGQRTVGSWVVLDTKDPITDKAFVVLQTPFDSTAFDYVKVNCEDGKPYLGFGPHGVKWLRKEGVHVKLRIDDGEVTESDFTTVVDDSLVAAPLSGTTYAKLAKASNIVARIETADGRVLDVVVHPKGTAKAMAPMLAACPISNAFFRTVPSTTDVAPAPAAAVPVPTLPR